jgi:hypothetical protein
MKKLYSNLIVLGLLFTAQLSMAQGKFNLEFYGGPQRSYNQVTFTPNQPDIDVITPWNYNLGVNFLKRIKPNLQLSIQAEYARNSTKTNNFPNYPDLNPSFERSLSAESFGNYSLGVRYNWDKANHGFYVQPSIGFTLNNYGEYESQDSLSINFNTINKQTEIIPTIRLETGYKYYTGRRNYFLVGIRHQQGLQNLNTVNFGGPRTPYSAEISRKGSYTSLFVGYGINLENWSKTKRAEYKNTTKVSKEAKRELAWSSGPYLMASGFLRFRTRSEREPNLEFSHITSGNTFGGGYRFNALSIETGYSTFGSATSFSLPTIGTVISFTNRNINAIPLTLKYDFLIGDKNRLRVGPTLSAYYIIGPNTEFARGGGSGGSGGFLDYSLDFSSRDVDLNGKVFFNAGMYAELPIFNSSLINFKISQNFGSPKVGVFDITGEANGNPVSFESAGTLNGFILEMGYKLPLNLLFKTGRSDK